MQNVRSLADECLKKTLENTDVFGTPFTLVDTNGKEYKITGMVNDIGVQISPSTGERVASRNIVCACRIKTLADLTNEIPCRGWRVKIADKDGGVINAFVQGNKPDRTMGIYNIDLGLDFEGENG